MLSYKIFFKNLYSFKFVNQNYYIIIANQRPIETYSFALKSEERAKRCGRASSRHSLQQIITSFQIQ